ncbi:nicotinate-nucleotide adenylyltransferase [Thiohalocapsa marina]|uniref:Probable nicotinate-nucleotide adenylyltransferase n=1 Tax=Thiohalocapsa marina TaxID=424902 RepID=A0A5M8FVF6_9GAMM|nr:nicotinate-nucleotide adenylyltransferase [Thiohalocapsa marina]KAA6187821.1 nicotinate-nucleotide adenylyltransferase [Thiohalocapsa marina]
MIGVFGGTFDPIHFGHLRPALDVHQALGLDELRFLPLNSAVHRAQPVASAAQRLAMVQAALAGEPGLRADDRELARAGPSYTVDTLHSLRQELGPRRSICLLVGGDTFNAFLDWHRPFDILALAHLVVMQRPGAAAPDDPALRAELACRGTRQLAALRQAPAGRIWIESVTQLDISATRIRGLFAAGRSPRYLLPDAVLELARREACYSAQRGHDAA